MARRERARTSNGIERCTLHWRRHLIAYDGWVFGVFDTVGLEEYELGVDGYLDSIKDAYSLIAKLRNEGGIHLLMFCVRAGRPTAAIRENYQLFYEKLCKKKVPIVLVITGLEEERDMDHWWTSAKSIFDRYGVVVDGHACITALCGPDQRYQQRYNESRRLVCDLVAQHCMDDGYKGDNGHEGGKRRFRWLMWFRCLMG